MTSYLVTGPNYIAVIPAALSADDARMIAADDSGLMPWVLTVSQENNNG